MPRLINMEVSWLSGAFGFVLLTIFIIYQVFNQVAKGKESADQSWKDVAGICWGFAVLGSIFGILWRLYS